MKSLISITLLTFLLVVGVATTAVPHHSVAPVGLQLHQLSSAEMASISAGVCCPVPGMRTDYVCSPATFVTPACSCPWNFTCAGGTPGRLPCQQLPYYPNAGNSSEARNAWGTLSCTTSQYQKTKCAVAGNCLTGLGCVQTGNLDWCTGGVESVVAGGC